MIADPRVLFTGFEPFDGQVVNPSWEAVKLVADLMPSFEVRAVRLPCVFGQSLEQLRAAIEDFAPDMVVCVGQDGGRAEIAIERVAVNLDDARIPDNAGGRPIDLPVVPGGPTAYFANLPVKECVAAITEQDIPAELSHSAGSFVCNHVFYGLMHLIATERPAMRGGFVHIPWSPEQVQDTGEPCLDVAVVARALRTVAMVSAPVTADLAVSAA